MKEPKTEMEHLRIFGICQPQYACAAINCECNLGKVASSRSAPVAYNLPLWPNVQTWRWSVLGETQNKAAVIRLLCGTCCSKPSLLIDSYSKYRGLPLLRQLNILNSVFFFANSSPLGKGINRGEFETTQYMWNS